MALFVLVVVLGAGFAVYDFASSQGPCRPDRATQTTTQLGPPSTFGAVTEYNLPGTSPWANGITVAGDGAVWFGEQGLPGVAHLDPRTGILVEYRWPCYPSSKNGGPVSSIWGIAIWNGRVWAADGDSNRLVGLDPGDESTTYLNTSSAKFPYLLAPANDGSLWFTALTSPATLGRLGQDLGVTVYSVAGLGHQEPIQVQLVNSSYAYLVALNPYNSSDSGLYSFNPRPTGSVISASRVGGDFKLLFPQSLSVSGGSVWVAQHLPSNVLGYDVSAGEWTVYPTSTVSYESSTLPYFIQVNGTVVWFNEHYANRMALLDPKAGILTEYSESNPPVSNATHIQNDLTIAATQAGAWFTSTSGNYVGFVSLKPPNFSISPVGSNRETLPPGGSFRATFRVTGNWSVPLSVRVSDSEVLTSVPKLISITATPSNLPSHECGSCTPVDFVVSVNASSSLQPGRYTLAVTVTEGLVYQTAYLFLTVP
jgi:streptogramin lyase